MKRQGAKTRLARNVRYLTSHNEIRSSSAPVPILIPDILV